MRLGSILLLLLLAMPGGARAEPPPAAPGWIRRFAPVLRQDTGDRRDYLAAFDFDGNWAGDDNWENQPRYPLEAVVYWALQETSSHAYLHYSWFHPRDYSRIDNPVTSHENDLEGVQLVLEKAPEGPRLVAAQAVFHKKFLRIEVPGGYPARGAQGRLVFEDERPVFAIEVRGHGVEAWEGGPFPGRSGVVYRPGEQAEEPAHPDDRDVTYALVPLETTLWAKRFEVGPDRTYARAQDFGGESFGYAFTGTSFGDHKAHAPWGWDAEGLPRGTFFLDPAAMLAHQFEVPGPLDGEYLPNPYTGSAAGRRARVANAFRRLGR